LAELKPGRKIILCKRGEPVAEIVPLVKSIIKKRPIGLKLGLDKVPDSFFDPLDDELLDLFSGKES
jgi:antitoxin (DNA-binding transcriptional repressor) of toxin-antitoxin stability system